MSTKPETCSVGPSSESPRPQIKQWKYKGDHTMHELPADIETTGFGDYTSPFTPVIGGFAVTVVVGPTGLIATKVWAFSKNEKWELLHTINLAELKTLHELAGGADEEGN